MPATRVTVCLDEPAAIIDPKLYGHFIEHLGACINSGIWVGDDSPIPNIAGVRRDVIQALKTIRVPVLRWPGGCFADDYHWTDGTGPRQQRPRTVNLWWEQSVENNHFGTHEFMALCRALGAAPYLAGNLGSGTPAEMRNWVEYCNYPGNSTLADRRAANGSVEPFNVRFWGVGNEMWGCGGNMDPADYAVLYRHFATYLRDFGGLPLFLIACGPDGNNHQWTRRFFDRLGDFPRIHGYAAHYYCGTAGDALQYTFEQWYELLHKALRMETLINQQRAIMDGYDPQRRIWLIIDEWGTWHPPTPGASCLWQQNTLRDALVAALTLDIFNRHADKVLMANLAQALNVLQALVLTKDQQMILTPTYHVFEMYRPHHGAQALRTMIQTPHVGSAFSVPQVAGSASLNNDRLTLSLVNLDAQFPAEISLNIRGGQLRSLSARELTHRNIRAHNTFSEPDEVIPKLRTIERSDQFLLPPASVTVLTALL